MRITFNNRNYDWEHLLDTYKKYVNENSIVLEIGASNINKTKQLSKHCKRLIGVEIIPERKPENFDNVEYLLGDWQELTKIVSLSSIDIAIASHVIEHVRDDLKALNELYEVLKPGGVAIINTPNRKRFVRAFIEFFTGERKFPYWEHIREYTENEIKSLIDKSNFKKYNIVPLVFGIHGGKIFIYFKNCPKILRKFANFYEIQLFK